MKTVIMIPAYNEAEFIGNVIRNIPKNFVEKVEILVIDDGSTDNTVEVAKKAKVTKIISHKENKGLGITFRDGLKTALDMGADIIVNIDADGQFDPQDIPKLVDPILKKKADMVTCSRFLDKNLTPKMVGIKRLGNKIFTKVINIVTGKRFTDTQCGFRAYSRKAALSMMLFEGYTYTQEVFLDLLEKGFTIKEVPCQVRGREGRSRLIQNVFSYGIRVITIIFRSLLHSRPLKFFGFVGAFLFIIGFLINFILFIRFLLIEQIYPYLSAAYVATLFILVGFLVLMLALIADMSNRQRKILEELLYEIRSRKK